jgi:ADP-L-glycero-D-manno-heptose 6-epimerase
MLWLAANPRVNGLYNLGTGVARSFIDLIRAIGTALGQPVDIEFIDMPETIRANYQYFTQADIGKLRAAGYAEPFQSLEAAVGDYVRNFLSQLDVYR